MPARIKDLALGLVASVWIVGAAWMTPAGNALATPSGEPVPTACWIRAATGYECPTCGMGRSFVAFFHGDLGHAFRFHPVGPLLAIGTVLVLGLVVGLALSGQDPLWDRRGFARALYYTAVAALAAGLVRMIPGGLG